MTAQQPLQQSNKMTTISKLASKKWQEMTEDQKKPYVERANNTMPASNESIVGLYRRVARRLQDCVFHHLKNKIRQTLCWEHVIQVNELELIGCYMIGVVTNVPTRTVRTAFFTTPMELDYLSMLERNNLGGERFATFCQCHRFGMLPTQGVRPSSPDLNMQQLY